MELGRFFTSLALAVTVAGGALAQQGGPREAAPAKEYNQQFLVPGSWFHGVHGLAFNKDDQLFAGSVIGQTIYRVQVDSGEVDRVIDPPMGMADDIAFADDGTMAWTAFLLGKVYIRKPNGKTIEVELIAFLRDEAKFETAEMLARQIAEDAAAARALLLGL
jgi:hypothetical protein